MEITTVGFNERFLLKVNLPHKEAQSKLTAIMDAGFDVNVEISKAAPALTELTINVKNMRGVEHLVTIIDD